jgi:hypothetical protein
MQGEEASSTNLRWPYQSLILGQKYCNTRINFADRERDQHTGVMGRVGLGFGCGMEICWAKSVTKLRAISTFFGKAVNDCLASLSRLYHIVHASISFTSTEIACNAFRPLTRSIYSCIVLSWYESRLECLQLRTPSKSIQPPFPPIRNSALPVFLLDGGNNKVCLLAKVLPAGVKQLRQNKELDAAHKISVHVLPGVLDQPCTILGISFVLQRVREGNPCSIIKPAAYHLLVTAHLR